MATKGFLDENQYTEENIRNYEVIFGKGNVSTGGEQITQVFTKLLNLKSGEMVLDFGSGLGGSAFYLAANYNVKVMGIDVSQNMISGAKKYLEKAERDVKELISFQQCDGMEQDFEEDSFDCIYSREVIVHIEDKETLFRKFHKWLKPGGRLLISDYCRGKDAWSDDFKAYVDSRNYFMIPIPEYAHLLSKVGFNLIGAQDRTDECIAILRKDLDKLLRDRRNILDSLTQKEYEMIFEGWQKKLQRCMANYQSWGLFTASK